jgi:hypothetical protein
MTDVVLNPNSLSKQYFLSIGNHATYSTDVVLNFFSRFDNNIPPNIQQSFAAINKGLAPFNDPCITLIPKKLSSSVTFNYIPINSANVVQRIRTDSEF